MSIETKEAEALGHLRMARAALLEAKDNLQRGSRELSVALTETDTAILWLQQDMQLKAPIFNVANDPDPTKCSHKWARNDRMAGSDCLLCGAFRHDGGLKR